MTGAEIAAQITTTVLTVAIMYGVTARLTRLITADTITGPLRARVMRRGGPDGWAYLWITCPWCVGLWLAFVVTLTVWGGERLLDAGPLVLAPGWLWVPGLACANNYFAARAQGRE